MKYYKKVGKRYKEIEFPRFSINIKKELGIC